MTEMECNDGKRAKTIEQYSFLAKCLAQNSKEQNGLCDVVIRVQDVSFYGSRLVLGSVSPVFKRMFLSVTREPQSRIFSLECVSLEGFRVIWDYIYDERYGTENEGVALAVLKYSHFLQIEPLCEEYTEKLRNMLRPENVFDILSISGRLQIQSLQEEALHFVARRFQEVIPTSDFFSMSIETLLMFLQRDDLEVCSEIHLYEAVKSWLNHDPTRNLHMRKLMNCVRLPLLPVRYLNQKVFRDPVISRDPYCLSLVVEAKDYHHPDLCDTVPVGKTRTRGTGYYRYPSTFWCLAKNGDGNQVILMNTRNWSVQILSPYPCPNATYLATAFEGADGKLFLTDRGFQVCDVARRVWENGPSPPADIQWPASAVGLNSIYLCGGRSSGTQSKKYLTSVNRFDLASWNWIPAPDMKFERHAASAMFLDSSLHVIGGVPNSKKHERLDTRTKTWCELSQWPGGRGRPALAIHNGDVYAAGGGCVNEPLLSDMHLYDKRKNDWRSLPPMIEKRLKHGLISFEGNLYAVGGENTPSVEMYDGTEWKVVARLDLEKCESACMMQWTNE